MLQSKFIHKHVAWLGLHMEMKNEMRKCKQGKIATENNGVLWNSHFMSISQTGSQTNVRSNVDLVKVALLQLRLNAHI